MLKEITIITFLALAVSPQPSYAQTTGNTSNANRVSEINGYVNPLPGFEAWLKKPWEGDDSQYLNPNGTPYTG